MCRSEEIEEKSSLNIKDFGSFGCAMAEAGINENRGCQFWPFELY